MTVLCYVNVYTYDYDNVMTNVHPLKKKMLVHEECFIGSIFYCDYIQYEA